MGRVVTGQRRTLVALFLGLALPVWATASAVRAQSFGGFDDEEAMEEESEPGQPRDVSRRGFYLGLGAMYALENADIDDPGPAIGTSLDATDSGGMNARFGYRFHRRLAVEVSGEYYAQIELETPNGLDAVRLEGFTITGNGKFFVLTGRLQPYLLAGAGTMYMKVSPGAFQLGPDRDRFELVGRAGPGVDFYIFDDLLVNVEATYIVPMGSLSDYQMVLIGGGLQYRF